MVEMIGWIILFMVLDGVTIWKLLHPSFLSIKIKPELPTQREKKEAVHHQSHRSRFLLVHFSCKYNNGYYIKRAKSQL